MEIVFDPPGHVRLPIDDDRTIDRILVIQPLVGRATTLITYDTNEPPSGRVAGLQVSKLAKPGPDPEPEPNAGRSGSRRTGSRPRNW
jgi:hypothetical protein